MLREKRGESSWPLFWKKGCVLLEGIQRTDAWIELDYFQKFMDPALHVFCPGCRRAVLPKQLFIYFPLLLQESPPWIKSGSPLTARLPDSIILLKDVLCFPLILHMPLEVGCFPWVPLIFWDLKAPNILKIEKLNNNKNFCSSETQATQFPSTYSALYLLKSLWYGLQFFFHLYFRHYSWWLPCASVPWPYIHWVLNFLSATHSHSHTLDLIIPSNCHPHHHCYLNKTSLPWPTIQ